MNRPNVLIISIDSLRADHLASYGYALETSPVMDLIASEGVLFENSFAAANWTGASLASILTGLYPTCHGYTNLRYYLDDDVEDGASLLRQHGYHTICFSNNMYLSSRTGMSRGFDEFYYQGQKEKNTLPPPRKSVRGKVLGHVKDALSVETKTMIKDILDMGAPSRAATRDDGAYATELAFCRWLERYDHSKPFFGYIHFQEPHSVYFPPKPFRKRFFSGSWREQYRYLQFDFMRYFAGLINFTESQVKHYLELYDGEIAYLDWRMGRILNFMRRRDLLDRTALFITADHGENMGENGFFWHAFCLQNSLIKVPLIARFPDWFSKDKRITGLVQNHDILPTLCEGLGIEWKFKNELQGVSFLNGAIREAALTETYNPEKMVDRWLLNRKELRKVDFVHYLRDLRAIQTLSDKLVWASDRRHQYYDLVTDPGESNNLYDSRETRVQKANRALQKWLAAFKPHVANDHQPEFDKHTWMKMKALGYA